MLAEFATLGCTQKTGDVTVVIVNWNSGTDLAECLSCLLAQTTQPSKILVIDNNSSDNSLVGIPRHKLIQIKKQSENLGFACGNNIALPDVSTTFLALLNPDAFPNSEWLEALLNDADSDINQKVGAWGSRQLSGRNAEQLDGIGDAYHASGLAWRIGFGKPITSRASQPVFSVCAAGALYRTEVVRRLGGFDEEYFCYFEDVDLGFRIRLAGYNIIQVPNAVLRHIGSASTGGQRSDFATYYGQRNLVWTFFKNMPWPLLVALFPAHMLANLAVMVRSIPRRQFKVTCRSKLHAFKRLPAVLARREKFPTRTVMRQIFLLLPVFTWIHFGAK